MSIDLPLTYNGIPYREISEGSGERSRRAGSRALLTTWNNSGSLMLALQGQTLIVDNQTIIIPPATHPGDSRLVVQDVKISPRGQPVGENQWKYAQLDVEYGIPQHGQGDTDDPTDLFELGIDFAAEVVTIPAAAFEMEDGEEPDEDIQKVVPQAEHQVTLFNVPASGDGGLPSTIRSAINSALGRVNSDSVLGASAGCLLFSGGSARKTETTESGFEQWTVTYKFVEDPTCHNKRFNGRTGNQETVTHKVTGNGLYEEASFGPLFSI